MKLVAYISNIENSLGLSLLLFITLFLAQCNYPLKEAYRLEQKGHYREAGKNFQKALEKKRNKREIENIENKLAICELNIGDNSLLLELQEKGKLKPQNELFFFKEKKKNMIAHCVPDYETTTINKDDGLQDKLVFFSDDKEVYYYSFEEKPNTYYIDSRNSEIPMAKEVRHNIRYFEHPTYIGREDSTNILKLVYASRDNKGSNLTNINLRLDNGEYAIVTPNPHIFVNNWQKELKIYFPVVDRTNQILVFSTKKDNSSFDLYISQKNSDSGSWEEPEFMTINTIGDEIFPFIDINNKLYFSSNGYPNDVHNTCQGGFDIHYGKLEGIKLKGLNRHRVSTLGNDLKFFSKGDGTYSGYFSTDFYGKNNQDIIHFIEKRDKNTTNHAIYFAMEEFADSSQNIPRAIDEVEKIDSILVAKYDFDDENTHIIPNPTKAIFFDSLNAITTRIKKGDRLFLIISTHGIKEKNFWVPAFIDAETQDDSQLIPQDSLLNILQNLDVQHVLLLADACWSPILKSIEFKNPGEFIDDNDINRQRESKKSRLVLTRGTKELVEKESDFLNYLALFLIQEEREIGLSSHAIFLYLSKIVRKTIPQWRQFSEKHEGGDFIFYLKEH